jgi:hypothetical protein
MGGGQSLDFYELHCDDRPLSTFVVDPTFAGVIHSAFLEAYKKKPDHVLRLAEGIIQSLHQESAEQHRENSSKSDMALKSQSESHPQNEVFEQSLTAATSKIESLQLELSNLREAKGKSNEELLFQPGKTPHDAMLINYAEAAKDAALSWQLQARDHIRHAEQTKESIMIRERHHRAAEQWFITQNLLPLQSRQALLKQSGTMAMEMATQMEERFSAARDQLRQRFTPLILRQQSEYVERFDRFQVLGLDAVWEALRKLDPPCNRFLDDPFADEFDCKRGGFKFENPELQLLAVRISPPHFGSNWFFF